MTLVVVSSGVTSSGLTISSGVGLVVLSGGTVASSTVLSGGSVSLFSGGFGAALTESKGGVIEGDGELEFSSSLGGGYYSSNFAAGTVSDVTLDIYASLEISSGGAASAVTVGDNDGNAQLLIDRGATATGTVVLDGILSIAGSATDTVVDCLADQVQIFPSTATIDSGGVASGLTIGSGGNVYVVSRGFAGGVAVQNEGYLTVAFAGVTTGVTVENGGEFDVAGTAYGDRHRPRQRRHAGIALENRT